MKKMPAPSANAASEMLRSTLSASSANPTLVRSRKATKYRMTSIGMRCLVALAIADLRAGSWVDPRAGLVADTNRSFAIMSGRSGGPARPVAAGRGLSAGGGREARGDLRGRRTPAGGSV